MFKNMLLRVLEGKMNINSSSLIGLLQNQKRLAHKRCLRSTNKSSFKKGKDSPRVVVQIHIRFIRKMKHIKILLKTMFLLVQRLDQI